MMFADLSDADIIFPPDSEEIRTHANRQVLVDIAFWGRHDVRIFCFDLFKGFRESAVVSGDNLQRKESDHQSAN